ncbi:MAG: YifB family Mg chelatase-like AAA ATPase [Lachnospiraceae bacterium]|jgi:magnesium chelatase family protein|nr:YifB family Mg chelatase-like AAA ATPase [Lachnospiraceae bacterium]
MYSRIITGALHGVSAYLVLVEVDVANGLPAFFMVGSLSTEVRESRERVTVALKNVGFHLPPKRITVNLSPADRKKDGTAFDLPIAVGMLEALEMVPSGAAEDILFLGELGLDGEVKKVKGVLPIVQAAREGGVSQCVVPAANAREAAVVPGMTVWEAGNILDILHFLMAGEEERPGILTVVSVDTGEMFAQTARGREEGREPWDFMDVTGQEQARRAAEIAAAGFHNLLMTGPPGAGKSMIAKRIPGILPPLTLEESLEVTSVVSVAGLLKEGEALVTRRPFRSPHHTISQAALIGGSAIPRPGMISLAHRGVLFLDELPEFQRQVLDALRQPLEDRKVNISRVNGNVSYPSDFMLVCAMNPCPCGYYPDRNRCRCSQTQIGKYMGRVSGPILDRMDLCVELQPVEYSNLKTKGKGESSREIRQRVEQARQRQKARFQNTPYRFNGDIEVCDIGDYCALGAEEQCCMERLYASLQLSARAYHRILRVARTIADLDGTEEIRVQHLTEAACYRPSLEYWQ